MSAGDIVRGPDGEKVVLVDIGQQVLLDNDYICVWSVDLAPGEVQPWHLHHNPYVVLCLQASAGRMDWLDGSPPRFLEEYVGGAVYRPTSPVHRLTNVGSGPYCNRLVELKDLGEKRTEPLDIAPGARSEEGQALGPVTSDGRLPVLDHPHTRIWTVDVQPGASVDLDLLSAAHLLVRYAPLTHEADPTRGCRFHDGGSLRLVNGSEDLERWYVVELTYLDTDHVPQPAQDIS